MSAPPTLNYTCRYCRQASDPDSPSCPRCGAPIDVRQTVSRSGWQEQPAIRDMARIQLGQSRVQIEGSTVPVADFDLSGPEWIYFSHHSLLWRDPSARLSTMSMAGGWNRMLSGLPLIMLEARGPGHVALSDNHAGEVVALPMQNGQQIWVREHRFLAATGNVHYTWSDNRIWFVTGSGDESEWHYPLGQYGDIFGVRDSPGLLLLHSPGNTFFRDLAAGETLLIQPSALLYRDVTVHAHLHIEYPFSANMGWGRRFNYRTVWLKLRGPGRVAVQSIFQRVEGSEWISRSSYQTSQSW